MGLAFIVCIPLSILVFWVPTESPIMHCLQHSRLPLAHNSKLFQLPPINQFQRTTQSVVTAVALLPVPIFWVKNFSHDYDKIPDTNNLKEERRTLFWLTVSEDSVHSCLVPWTWADIMR
jgi:hypothetical protein